MTQKILLHRPSRVMEVLRWTMIDPKHFYYQKKFLIQCSNSCSSFNLHGVVINPENRSARQLPKTRRERDMNKFMWNLFPLLTVRALISFRDETFSLEIERASWAFSSSQGEGRDLTLSIRIVLLRLLTSLFIVHLFGSIIYYFRMPLVPPFFLSRQPHIRLDQITQNYFSRVWEFETVFSERAILNRNELKEPHLS